MISKFDYNSEDVMKILNNPEYTDEQKKQLFDKYKNDLKVLRKKEIISRRDSMIPMSSSRRLKHTFLVNF